MNNEARRRYLIVNADDFGLSPGVNRGVMKSHEHGIVSSASVMVRWPAASEAATYARAHSELSVGLHVDLCEWRFTQEAWKLVYEVVPTNNGPAVAEEVARQLAVFRRLMGRDPTHLDSHQHVHHREPVHSVMVNEARKLGIVLRSVGTSIKFCGDFYGQSRTGHPFLESISVNALRKIFMNLPAGTTEMGCHPGLDDDVESAYRSERKLECETLCDPRVRAALSAEGIVLCSFSDQRGQLKK